VYLLPSYMTARVNISILDPPINAISSASMDSNPANVVAIIFNRSYFI